jgi:hypothetical protein
MDDTKINKLKKTLLFTMDIVKAIETQIKRSLNKDEENLVITTVRNMPNNYFSTYSLPNIISIIKNIVIDEISIEHREINDIDTHELMKQAIDPDVKYNKATQLRKKKGAVPINVDSVFGYTDIAKLVKKAVTPVSSVNNAYLLLDTRHRILENDGTEYFSWGHMNQLTTSQGTVNSLGNIRDIISILMMPYKIPNVQTTQNPYDLITVSIEEFTPQSIVAHEDRRFHFIGCINRSESDDRWLRVCNDDYHKAEYKFNKPITSIDTLTLKFGNPLEPIFFDKDRLPGTITYGTPTIINFTENHNILTGDAVYIDNFITINPAFDSTPINGINSRNGVISTVLTPTSISIPVDTSSINKVLTGTISTPNTTTLGTINAVNNIQVINGIGTSFQTDFITGDYIKIQDNTNNVYQIKSIKTNTYLTITTKYTGTTGNYAYVKTGLSISGVGTLFNTELKPGDNVIINDGGENPSFIVKKIQSNTKLILTSPYNGLSGVGFSIDKYNTISNIWSVFFSTKRMFIALEITYLSS